MENYYPYILALSAGIIVLLLLKVMAKTSKPRHFDLEDDLDDDTNPHQEIKTINNAALLKAYSHSVPKHQETVVKKPVRKPVNMNTIIILNVMAQPGEQFVGYELLQALLSSGMRFGDMSVFHRHEEKNGKGNVLFSLASSVEPGTFDLTKMGSFSCPGLSVFMRLDQVDDPYATFELMVRVCQQLADDLSGVVLDAHRQELTSESIDHIRQQIIAYSQQQLETEL